MDTEANSPAIDPAYEAVPEGTPHPALDVVIRHWLRIAAFAWERACTQGPGNVLVTLDAPGVPLEYWAGSLCDCHRVDADTYDPATQVVVAARDAETEWPPIILTGWPTPEAAFASTNVDIMGGTVH